MSLRGPDFFNDSHAMRAVRSLWDCVTMEQADFCRVYQFSRKCERGDVTMSVSFRREFRRFLIEDDWQETFADELAYYGLDERMLEKARKRQEREKLWMIIGRRQLDLRARIRYELLWHGPGVDDYLSRMTEEALDQASETMERLMVEREADGGHYRDWHDRLVAEGRKRCS